MKKLILLILAAATAFLLCANAMAEFDPDVDYMAVMFSAAKTGDSVTGLAASAARMEKIDSLSMDESNIDYNDLYLLAKIIYAEAGSAWLSDEWKMCVGEVVLNRVASPEFPNSISEVIYQPGQYYSSTNTYFANLQPSERCIQIALRLLNGERYMNNPAVVFQANFPQGSGVFLQMTDRYLGTTYFCLSNYPALYTSVTITLSTPENASINSFQRF